MAPRTNLPSPSSRRPRRPLLRATAGVLALAVATSACAAASTSPAATSNAPAVSVQLGTSATDPTSTVSAPSPTTPVTPVTPNEVPPTAVPATTAPEAVPSVQPPLPPVPLVLAVAPAEQAVQVADALAGTDEDRLAGILAAFDAAGLPVLAQDASGDRSVLTATEAFPVGLPWSAVAAVTLSARPDIGMSLAGTVDLFRFVDPAGSFDADVATAELLGGLRTALADPSNPGPHFLAQLVAEQSRRTAGVELADPVVTADDIILPESTSLLLLGAAVQAMFEHVAVATAGVPSTPPVDDTANDAANDGASGPPRAVHGRRSGLPTTAECADDGAGGWVLWVVSKIATGTQIPLLPISYEGMYTELTKLGLSRGRVTASELDLVAGIGKTLGVANGLLAVALFKMQVADRRISATMDGDGPLLRTKTTDHGQVRNITLEITYDSDDPKIVQQRNCMLALLSVLGNNNQQAIGPAAGVTVGVQGGQGFATGLAAGDAYMIFDSSYKLEQVADESGRVTIVVQGRAQRRAVPDSAAPVDKVFSLHAEATLDPLTASTFGRHLADDLLCASTFVGAGAVTGTAAECINAVLNIAKAARWDFRELEFPVTDWSQAAWGIDTNVGPFRVTATKCGGDDGLWLITIAGEGYLGEVTVAINGDTLEGAYDLQGTASYGGATFSLTGTGLVSLVKAADGTAELRFTADTAQITGPGGTANGSLDGAVIPVHPLESCPGE